MSALSKSGRVFLLSCLNDCFQQFLECLDACADEDTWYQRAACALDCELDLLDCLLARKIGGRSGRGNIDTLGSR